LAFDLARMVGPGGSVVATDIDEAVLALAREEAATLGLNNIEFRLSDITRDLPEQGFDLVHARFLLTHLRQREAALAHMRQALGSEGLGILEDIDFQGYFCFPDLPALWRYVDLHTRAMQRRGGDPNLGPRLPALLSAAGFRRVEIGVVQPVGISGEVKLITPITMESIAEVVESDGLATRAEIESLVTALYEFANTPGTVGGLPRVVQAWGYADSPPEERSGA
jgi:hypothetical protein